VGKKFGVIILFSLLGIRLSGQIYNINRFDKDYNLPSSYVNDILQTKQGFLYIATAEGICYYNGKEIKLITSKDSSQVAFTTCMLLKDDGSVLTGLNSGGFCLVKNNESVKIHETDGIEGPVTCVTSSGKSIVFGTKQGKVGVYADGKISYIEIPNCVTVNRILNVQNNILAATDNGVYDVSDLKNPILIGETAGQDVTAMRYSRNTYLYLGTSRGELYIFIKANNAARKFKLIKYKSIGRGESIRSILTSGRNKIAIGTWGDGIYMANVNYQNFGLEDMEHISTVNGIDNPYVNCIYKSINGTIWIGTHGGNLYKFNSNKFKLLNKNSGLESNKVRSVYPFNGKVYIGLNNCVQANKNNVMDTLATITLKSPEKNNLVNSISHFKDQILLGTEKEGLLILDPKKNTLTDFFKNVKVQYPPKTINHLENYRDSLIYICSSDGLFVYHIKTQKIVSLTTIDGLPHNNITFSFVDSKKRIWLVAPKSPPVMIENDSITLHKDIKNFRSYSASSICEGRNGEIFIATNGDGIFEYNNNVFTQHSVNDGMLSNYVMGMCYVPKKNMLILTHQNGLSLYNRDWKKFSTLTKKDLFSYDNTLNSIVSDKNTVYFGTEQGLGIYFTENDEFSLAPPINNLTSVIINDVEYPLNDSIIDLPYDDYNITFNYIGVELANPEKITYELKLNGLEKNFKISTENSETYHELKDGDYCFMFTSINSEGIKNAKYNKFYIRIDSPFYKKIWFVAFAIIFIVGMIILLFRLRVRKLRIDNMILENKVLEKTEDITKMNQLLEDRNLDITSSIDYAKRIQSLLLPTKHEIQSNLNCFIYYKPRDIVSGDFYWFHKTNKYIYLAAVDCTGHGVPGAFMSVLGIAFLDQIMSESSDPLPSKILSELDKKIVKSLRQTDSIEKIGDGMDMALCRIDTTASELIYAGAGRPVYTFISDKFVEYKSAIYGIGGFSEGGEKVFEDQFVKYAKNDMVYLFTDGYGDQFGGEGIKKYSKKRMRDLFTDIHKKESNAQYASVKNDFENWKGDKAQIDDVLVIGIKLG
jgi:serine phosphatase RsbU (regulator of sigma subunit)/ligand-binding sensor domain-containing protein